jgi:hypothetical protein
MLVEPAFSLEVGCTNGSFIPTKPLLGSPSDDGFANHHVELNGSISG